MKRFMLTVFLTCALSVSTLAGEMPTAGATSTTSPPATSAATAPPPGEMPTAGAKPPEEAGEMPGILEILIYTIITWP